MACTGERYQVAWYFGRFLLCRMGQVWATIMRGGTLGLSRRQRNQNRKMDDPADWVYAVAASQDGKTIVAGAGDGKPYFWNQADGKLLRAPLLGAGTTVAAAHPGASK